MRSTRRATAALALVAAFGMPHASAGADATPPVAASPVAAPAASYAPGTPSPVPDGGASVPPAPVGTPVPLRSVAASAHRAIATTSPAAQAAYDRGLIFLYAFNIGAAREAFAKAARLDPQCAMAPYGEALAEVTDINVDPDSGAIARGHDAILRATRAKEASPDERALIAALARRFARASDDEAAKRSYERNMQSYAERHPDDADGAVETAFAIWQAEPSLSTATAKTIGPLLDRALALDPDSFGAHHLRIHFEEESGRPADALPDARFLDRATYAPGMSHLPHMAGHIFVRLGDYAHVVSSNETAIANDAAYFALGDGPGQTYMRSYHDHDLDFVLYGLTTIGRDAEARSIASHEDDYARVSVAMRLHDWKAVVASRPANETALAIAQANLGDAAAAHEALAALATSGHPATPLTRAFVEGGLARSRHDDAAAAVAYAKAYDPHARSLGDPKSHWQTPIGEAYGAALLRSGEAADAEKVFTDELARYPNDPHLLIGRAFAREALHEDATADRAAAAAVWTGEKPLKRAALG